MNRLHTVCRVAAALSVASWLIGATPVHAQLEITEMMINPNGNDDNV